MGCLCPCLYLVPVPARLPARRLASPPFIARAARPLNPRSRSSCLPTQLRVDPTAAGVAQRGHPGHRALRRQRLLCCLPMVPPPARLRLQRLPVTVPLLPHRRRQRHRRPDAQHGGWGAGGGGRRAGPACCALQAVCRALLPCNNSQSTPCGSPLPHETDAGVDLSARRRPPRRRHGAAQRTAARRSTASMLVC